jgi:hypothetical protein
MYIKVSSRHSCYLADTSEEVTSFVKPSVKQDHKIYDFESNKNVSIKIVNFESNVVITKLSYLTEH